MLAMIEQQGHLHPVGPHVHGTCQLCRPLALLAFEMCFWDDKKRRLALLSMLSSRAAKQASGSFAKAETKLKGHISRVAILAEET